MDGRSDSAELGYLATKTILGRDEKVTAIFAGSDQIAFGVYYALHESSIAIPGEISVVGFNDTLGSFFYPSLTSVREFPEELGRNLAELVLHRIQNPQQVPQQIIIPTRVENRDSVQAPESSNAVRKSAVEMVPGSKPARTK
jgi:DNA-binding LacI/PurR family transcriptional regulator